MNKAARLWGDSLRAACLRLGGRYLYYDTSKEGFRELSTYWAAPVLFAFLRIIFPAADIIYTDTDAFLFPDLLELR